MFDGFLGSLAGVIDKLAAYMPVLPDLHMSDIAAAFDSVVTVLKVLMDTINPMYTGLVVAGLMMAVKLFLIAWYWIMWVIKKIPGVS